MTLNNNGVLIVDNKLIKERKFIRLDCIESIHEKKRNLIVTMISGKIHKFNLESDIGSDIQKAWLICLAELR